MHDSPRRVYLSLGANLGDRAATIAEAIRRIDALPGTRVVQQSRLLETPPWGKTDQPPFLNMVIAVDTCSTPHELLHACQQIELQLGRQRTEHWGPRTIDIDLLLYEGVECATPELTLPHPYLLERRFVLEPLADIAPDLLINGKTVRTWLSLLPS